MREKMRVTSYVRRVVWTVREEQEARPQCGRHATL